MYAQDNNTLPVWIILSPAYHHISTDSQPFLVGIVSGSENNTRVTPVLVQLSPGGENAKELPEKPDFMGESKVYAVNSRRPKNNMASKGYTCHQARQA